MTLPSADTGPQMDPLLVAIDAKGAVFFGRGPMREEVDGADAGRDLPVLRKRLAVWRTLGEEHGMRAVAQLRVHDDAPQERVFNC